MGRTGAYLSETRLTPAAVQSKGLTRFSLFTTWDVDGQVYAQPLYVPGVKMPDGTRRNILYVATTTNYLYAFDTDNLWNKYSLWPPIQLGVPAGPQDLPGWNVMYPNSADEVLLRPIRGRNGTHISTGVTVRRILPIENGRSGYTVCFSRRDTPTKTESIECRVLILAANAIQSPRLLKNSGLEGRRFGAVGQFLTFHMDVKRSAFFPQLRGGVEENSAPVMIKKLAVMDFYLPDKHNDAYINHASIQTGSKPGAIVYGKDHLNERSRYPEFIEVQTIVEDLPQARNMVGLSSGRDYFGDPYPQVIHSFDPMDVTAANATLGRIESLIQLSGGELVPKNLQPDPAKVRPNGSHLMGSLRMSSDPQFGAVDGMCRLYGLDNLFVTDGSAFATSAGVNPALTIAANAFRVADYIYEKVYHREPKLGQANDVS